MGNEPDGEDYKARYRELLAETQRKQYEQTQDHERRLKIVEENYVPRVDIMERFEKLGDKLVKVQIQLAGLIGLLGVLNKVLDHVWKP